MHPAPGYDNFLPHDVLHFIAEAEWGIDDAVFSQLAAGGDAGTFWPVEHTIANKWRHRGERLRRNGSGFGRSELIAGVLEYTWNVRHGRAPRAPLPPGWRERLRDADVDFERLEVVISSLDKLAERWHRLGVGESLTLEWPRPERREHRRRVRRAAR